ncbi:MAG: VWA domain-containing protein [Pirellulaceae bacterium]
MSDFEPASDWTHLHSASERNPFFGEVQHRLLTDGDRQVKVIIQPDTELGFELSRAALAIDGSKSMMQPFAAHLPPMLRKNKNMIHPTVQSLALYLADNAKGQVALAYWACGDDGSDIEPVGIMTKDELNGHTFAGPSSWGGGTQMTPVARYFWEQVFADAAGPGVAVIVTDGAWSDEDHQALEALTAEMCAAIEAGQRPLLKFVVVGLRLDSNSGDLDNIQSRFTSLDDFNTDTSVDVWDHKWLDEMADISDIFVEMVQDWPLGVGGYVEAEGAKVLETDEFKFGIEFRIPASATGFTLHINDVGDYEQALT